MARRVGIALFALAGGMPSGPARADACRDAFIKVMTDRSPKGPTKTLSTTTLGGQKPMISINYRSANGDWMTEVKEPAGVPWSLAVGTRLYASRDMGRTWQKVRDMNDAGHDPAAVQRELQETAATAANPTCGVETVGENRLEKIEADVTYARMNMKARQAFWVDAGTGRVFKSWQRLSVGGAVTEIAETIEYLTDLTLPRPQ